MVDTGTRTSLLRRSIGGLSRLSTLQSRLLMNNRSRYASAREKPESHTDAIKDSADPQHRSSDAPMRRPTAYLTLMNNLAQKPSQGLLTFVSQPFSNAAAPGPPSVFSQWSPQNGETLTDDELFKGTTSHSSSRADERATTLSGERTTTKNNSAGRTLFGSAMHGLKNFPHTVDQPKNPLHYIHPDTRERLAELPFDTYVEIDRKNTNSNRYVHRRLPTPPPSYRQTSLSGRRS